MLAITAAGNASWNALRSFSPTSASEPLEAAKLPDDKILVPGLVDSCVTYVEHPRLIAQRLQRYVDIVGRDRVIAGTDCGFATWAVVGYQVMPSIVPGVKRMRSRSPGSCAF